ncbi:uncharacterized protein LOC109846233 [Asparagus officinalis]|uniref:uncharacterized protein LOC109846233 n=1 Tax=Asparagus officinalis TaxID=4686 RepID=UPI00098E2269|nr:uncharacterized protein LOC109846233 [Asparagus officinalis]
MDKHPSTCPYPHLVIKNRSTGKTNLASALARRLLASFVLTPPSFVFLLFRPRDPSVGHRVASPDRRLQLHRSFTSPLRLRQNPNAILSHWPPSLLTGSRVGFMYIPAGEIAGDRTQYMEASFAVGKFDRSGDGNVVEVETRIGLKGSVRVLKVFMHRVQVVEQKGRCGEECASSASLFMFGVSKAIIMV